MCSGDVTSAAQALEFIRAGLVGLAACDIDSPGAAALGEECEQILRAVDDLHVQAARRLARFAALGGPAAAGAPSVTGWLGHRCRLRPWEARQLATTATRLNLLGETLTAFADGAIGFGDVATIAEGIDRAADTMTPDWSPERIAKAAQPLLLEAATALTPAQLRKAACGIALALDGSDSERRRRQIERQAFLTIGQNIEGVGLMHAEMGAADLALVEKAIDTFAPRPDPRLPRWQNIAGHRRLRGLVTICRIALRESGRRGRRERGGAPVRVHVIATPATIDPHVPATQAPPGRTEYGTILTAGQIREMIQHHHAGVLRIRIGPDGRIVDRVAADGQPLNWGRTRRLFTPAQRDVFLTLYAGCAADGCDRPPAWTDIDHKRAWTDGGRTDLDNGQPLCRWHNLQKEQHRKRGEGRSDQEGPDPPVPDG